MLFIDRSSDSFTEKSSISSEDDDASQEPFLSAESRPKSNNRSRSRSQSSHLLTDTKNALLFISAILITILTTFLIITHLQPFPHSPPSSHRSSSSVDPEQILECGTSADEARYRGCVFDVMHYSWIPAPCYNATLSQQYWDGLTALGIEFWNDTSKQHVLPYEEILDARHEYVYTSWLLHLKHCQYLLHRQIQSLVYGLPLDNLLRNASHAEHCLEEVRSPGDVKTMLYSGTAYLKCASGLGDIGPIYWNQPSHTTATEAGI